MRRASPSLAAGSLRRPGVGRPRGEGTARSGHGCGLRAGPSAGVLGWSCGGPARALGARGQPASAVAEPPWAAQRARPGSSSSCRGLQRGSPPRGRRADRRGAAARQSPGPQARGPLSSVLALHPDLAIPAESPGAPGSGTRPLSPATSHTRTRSFCRQHPELLPSTRTPFSLYCENTLVEENWDRTENG